MADTETAVFSIHIDATKEAVWQEITRTDKPHDGDVPHGLAQHRLQARGELPDANPKRKVRLHDW